MGKLRIISESQEPFRSRREAGILLAGELKGLGGKNALVLGIPRGGVVIADEIANILKGEVDILLSRKIGAPGNPELAIGAINEEGEIFVNEALAARVGSDKDYIRQEKKRQRDEIARRAGEYRRIRPKVPLKGKIVVVTDDGVATGATMEAALLAAGKEDPKELIAAFPVGSKDAVEKLVEYCNEVVVLRVPSFFGALSQFYSHFEQVSDEEVMEILKSQGKKKEIPR